MSFKNPLLQQIEKDLESRWLELLCKAWGPKYRKEGQWLRFGENGGRKARQDRCYFYDHVAEVQGGVFSFIIHNWATDFKDAVNWAKNWLNTPAYETPLKSHGTPKQETQCPEKTNEDRLAQALNYWNQSIDWLIGTPAEAYFMKRQVPLPDVTDCHFLQEFYDYDTKRAWPAVIYALRPNPLALPRAVQIACIQPNGDKAPVLVKKRTYGIPKGCFTILRADPSSRIDIIGEGAENLLTAGKHCQRGTLVCCAGKPNIKNHYTPSPGTNIVIAIADNDKDQIDKNFGYLAVLAAQKRLLSKEQAFEIVLPPHAGIDLNDIERGKDPTAGPGWITDQMNAALLRAQAHLALAAYDLPVRRPAGKDEHKAIAYAARSGGKTRR